jgi:hypothetical protein
MAKRSTTTSWQDWATRLLSPLGLMIVMAAAAAFIVAGVFTADTFVPGAPHVFYDKAIAGSTSAWAVPLGLAGIATVFTAVVAALSRIRADIRGRRDALVHALPVVLNTTSN